MQRYKTEIFCYKETVKRYYIKNIPKSKENNFCGMHFRSASVLNNGKNRAWILNDQFFETSIPPKCSAKLVSTTEINLMQIHAKK